jgi:uncharacterized membrane protein
MKIKFSGVYKIIFASISFTILLLIARIIYTGEFTYAFYMWNLFLALIPLVASARLIHQNKLGIVAVAWLSLWLLFFPNSPYLVTDLFHFKERSGCPQWFDLVLVSSATWNGIFTGILSLLQVERFLKKFFENKWVQISLAFFIILCGYGVYMGRFLRFNSWDLIIDPIGVGSYIKNSLVHPHQNLSLWAFTVVFSGMFGIIFFTIKNLKIEN